MNGHLNLDLPYTQEGVHISLQAQKLQKSSNYLAEGLVM